MCEGVRAELPTGSDEASDVAVREAPRLEDCRSFRFRTARQPRRERIGKCVRAGYSLWPSSNVITTGLGGKAAPACQFRHTSVSVTAS